MAKREDPATVLVTGAGRWLGRAIALDFASRGWHVGVHHRTSAEEAFDLIEGRGSQAAALGADLARLEDLEPLVAACAESLGTPTCLINNAACFEWDMPASLDVRSWQLHLDVNLRAPIFLTQAFARALPGGAAGNVINLIDQKVLRLDPEFFCFSGRWV
jgi:NAD(P)-dependent dehydrogenase (short-subunit alcohol dehydrogenase family)